jgi:hypothetical protein
MEYSAIGLILLVFAMIEVWKTFKNSSVNIKWLWCTGIFFASIILSTVFTFALNPDISPYAFGRAVWMFAGFIATILALILKFVYTRRKYGIKSKEYKSVKKEAIMEVIGGVVVLAGLFLYDYYKTASCVQPNIILGDTCCVPNTEWGFVMCQEEAEKMKTQLETASNKLELTEERVEDIAGFNLLIPQGYFAIRNITLPYQQMPLYLVALIKDSDSTILIRVLVPNDQYETDTQTTFDEFKRGVIAATPNTSFSEPRYLTNKDAAIEIVLSNMTTNLDDTPSWHANAIIMHDNSAVFIDYLSDDKMIFDSFYEEFEKMVYSAEIN